jgi:hypothetical protein
MDGALWVSFCSQLRTPPLARTPAVMYRVGVRAEHRIRTYLEYRFGACTLEFHRRCVHISSHRMSMCKGPSPPQLHFGGAWFVTERGEPGPPMSVCIGGPGKECAAPLDEDEDEDSDEGWLG